MATPATPVLTSFAQTSLTSARLSYTCASCVGTFKIYSNNSLVASIPGLTYDLTVASNTTYAVTASFVSSDTGFASPKPTALSLTTMATPSAPTITLGAGASVIASTVAVSGASAYLFYEKPYSGGSEVLVRTSTATSFSHSDASTNTLFSYRVVYVKNGITSAFSPVSSLTTPNPGRSSITAVKGSGVDRGHMMLNWTSVPSVDYYRISRYLKGVYGVLIPAATTSFSYVDTSPTPSSVSYQANIEACESHDFCAVTSQSASWSIDALPSVPVVTTTINGTGQLDITLSTAGSLSSQCFHKTTSGVSTSDTAVATFTGLSQSFIGLTDGQIYYIACRNSNVMWDGPLSDEVSETPRARMAAFTLAATTPSRITKGSSQNPISTVSGWTAGHYGSIDISTAYTGSSVATLKPSTSTQSITAPMTRTDSTTAMVVTFTAKDRHYPATTLGTTTVSVLGKLPFTYTKAIVTDANVCKVRYTTNSTSLDNGDTNPILMTLSGDSSAINGVLSASSKSISGATAVDLAELTIPAFGEGIKAASGVSTGAQYLTYDWLAYEALPTTAAQISTASSACVMANIATSPACWSWQWRTIGMSRKVGTTAEACSTCNSENKPYGVTDALDWTGTIAVGASVAAGTGHVCYVTTSDTVKCAGSNNYGQLGNDTVTNSATMVDVLCGQAITADCAGGKLSRVVKIVAIGNTTCALSRGGIPYCWGAGKAKYSPNAASSLTPLRFRDNISFTLEGALDIGFSGSAPYGVKRAGTGIGFNGVDEVVEGVTMTSLYPALFDISAASEMVDDSTSASWFNSETSKIKVMRAAGDSINYVSWVSSSGAGSASDARNAACKKVTLLTK